VADALKKTVLKAFGLLLVLVGIVIFILPVPFGIPIVAVGLVILISTSRTARRMVRLMRMRFDRVERVFAFIERNVPASTQKILRMTRRRVVGRRRAPTL
jgi:hypothetical protein